MPFVSVTVPEAQPFRWTGGAPACLLIHGLTSTPFEVRPVGEALHAAGFHAESFWLPGHGSKPEALRHVTWRDWSAAVEAQYDRMRRDHGSVAVLGTSLGGSLALWLGITRRPAAIVSMGGAVWLPRVAALARPISWIRPFQQKRAQGSAIFDDEARARHPSYPKTSMHAVAEMRSLVGQIKGKLAAITAPLLVMHARQDSVIPPENARYIMAHVRSTQKELLWLEKSDHIITEDYDRDLVSDTAVQWIERIAASE
ncbi:MAG: alpha/beta fold hydrolase [Anaerolineales bacterium]|nr:alpha/beta fold hydrolase [Anaerolineales bacterium]MCB9127711.1 alpha/beta fold hydrolase [Ardenticatenales bacterium]